MAQNWETPVAIVETKIDSGIFTLKPKVGGKYSSEDAPAIVKALLAAKVKLDGWKVWLDGDFETTLDKGQTVTPTLLAKIVKEADEIQLAYVKRPFPQPKLRFVKGGGTQPARKGSDKPKPREL